MIDLFLIPDHLNKGIDKRGILLFRIGMWFCCAHYQKYSNFIFNAKFNKTTLFHLRNE